MKVKKDFEAACNEYLRLFCKKHDYDFEEAREGWVGGRVGEITCVGDLFIDLRDIRTDIDRDAAVDEFGQWYDYCLRLGAIDCEARTPNYEHWVMGCPRMSEEQIAELEAAHKKVEESRANLYAMLKAAQGAELEREINGY